MLYEINVVFFILQMRTQKSSHVTDSLCFLGKCKQLKQLINCVN
jgi:hypothetical protein